MASLQRHSSGRSPYWFAKFADENGRVVVKSTKQRERKKALAVLVEWEQAALGARQGALTEDQCRKVLDQILERTTGERLRSESAEEFLKRWLKGKELARSGGTHVRYEGTVNIFVESLGDKAGKNIGMMLARDIERFRDRELKAGKAPSTVNVDLKTLRNAFNSAKAQGLIVSNPVNAIEFPKEKRNERQVFAIEQIQAILLATDGEWKTAVLLGFYLGARLGDAVKMNWSQMDLSKRVVNYTQEKTGKVVECPMHQDLEMHLLRLSGQGKKPEAQLTPALAEIPVGGRNGLSRAFKRIMELAKVDDGRVEGNGGRGRAFSKLSFHSLRHSFNSVLANNDVSQEIRMKLTGHSTQSANDIYTKLQLEPLKAAISKLPSVATKQGEIVIVTPPTIKNLA